MLEREKQLNDYTLAEICSAFSEYIGIVELCEGVSFVDQMDEGIHRTITELVNTTGRTIQELKNA